MNDTLDLLLAFDDGPAAPLPGDALAGRGSDAAAQELPRHLRADNDDIDDLTLQRYAVITPAGARGERLRALVEPLVRRRQDEQRAEVKTYPVPARMSQSEAESWLARLRASFARPRDEPRYFLLLGDLDEVPLSVQRALALADACPGRLAFDRDDDYAAYAARALREETYEPRPTIGLCGPDTDKTIRGAREVLLGPLGEQLRYSHDLGELPAAAIVAQDDLAAAAALPRPFLFTLSHGYGGDRKQGFPSAEHRRREQGSLCLPGGARLVPSDVAARPFVQDGFWFLFACYGAGTPDDSAFAPWLREIAGGQLEHLADQVLRALPPAGERPFIAGVPKAALANPQGPLACYGHVDVAWNYSYVGADSSFPSRPTKFGALVEDACRGRRAGAIARGLARAATDAALRLAAEAEQLRRDPGAGERQKDRIAKIWMLHHDLASYVLLGDPALRLRLPRPPAQATTPAPAAPAAPAADVSGDLAAIARRLGASKLEEALAKALVSETRRNLARQLGVDVDVFKALEDAYRAAGRRALGLD